MTARKGVTAWEIEPMEENGDEFFVLTFHHGLGEMTRLDLGADDVQDIAAMLTRAIEPESTMMRANLSTTGREPYHTEAHLQTPACRAWACRETED